MARVSVLLPVRDAIGTLDACLDSLRAQTLRDHEVVVIDDGSRDGSGERLRAAAAGDPRIRLLAATGRGLVAALNQAAAAAAAPLVARMDADDVAHPERLAIQVQRHGAGPGVDVLGCRVRCLAASGEGMRTYVDWLNGLLNHAAIARDLFVESPLAHPSVLLRRATLLDLGGYREFDGPEDYDLWLRAHDAGLRFAKCPETLLDWRDGPRRLTRTDPRYAPERFRALKVQALVRGSLARGRRTVVWGAGPVGKAFAKALLAAAHPVAGFVEVDPAKIGQRLYGAPVVGLAEALSRFPEAVHLGAVGQPGARQRLRDEARRLGLVDGENFIAVA